MFKFINEIGEETGETVSLFTIERYCDEFRALPTLVLTDTSHWDKMTWLVKGYWQNARLESASCLMRAAIDRKLRQSKPQSQQEALDGVHFFFQKRNYPKSQVGRRTAEMSFTCETICSNSSLK